MWRGPAQLDFCLFYNIRPIKAACFGFAVTCLSQLVVPTLTKAVKRTFFGKKEDASQPKNNSTINDPLSLPNSLK